MKPTVGKDVVFDSDFSRSDTTPEGAVPLQSGMGMAALEWHMTSQINLDPELSQTLESIPSPAMEEWNKISTFMTPDEFEAYNRIGDNELPLVDKLFILHMASLRRSNAWSVRCHSTGLMTSKSIPSIFKPRDAEDLAYLRDLVDSYKSSCSGEDGSCQSHEDL